MTFPICTHPQRGDIPYHMIGAYTPIPATELEMLTERIDSYIRTITTSHYLADEYSQRINELRQIVAGWNRMEGETAYLLSLALIRKWEIEEAGYEH